MKEGLPSDSEFNAFLRGAMKEVNPSEKVKRLAEARDRQPKVNALLQIGKWAFDKYPELDGKMSLDDFIGFLKEEKARLDKEVEDGKKP